MVQPHHGGIIINLTLALPAVNLSLSLLRRGILISYLQIISDNLRIPSLSCVSVIPP